MTDTNMSYRSEITIKDMNKRGQNVLNNSIIESVFLKDHKKAYLYKKAEKLSQAVHVVLAHAKNTSNISDRLSSLSVALIGEVLHSNNKSEGSATILEIISVLQVGETAGVIAPKNAELLVREYNYLLVLSCDRKAVDVDLDTDVEEVKEATKIGASKTKISSQTEVEPKGHKGQTNDRKGQVLQMIKENGNVGIKDIAKVITDCSEKTIQRLLNTLIKEGSIRKEGERRWSTYHYV
tara:strand:+ start:7742 stop:8452 length:711 start_codon:yes stop_codon:yes gene_type:complete